MLRQGVQGITDLITTPGPDQPRLRRREVDHVRLGSRADGHRFLARRGPGGDRRRHGDLLRRSWRRPSTARTACCCPSRAAEISGFFEINEAAQLVSNSAAVRRHIIFGAVIDDALGDEVRVTVIAAGFDEQRPGRAGAIVVASVPRRSAACLPAQTGGGSTPGYPAASATGGGSASSANGNGHGGSNSAQPRLPVPARPGAATQARRTRRRPERASGPAASGRRIRPGARARSAATPSQPCELGENPSPPSLRRPGASWLPAPCRAPGAAGRARPPRRPAQLGGGTAPRGHAPAPVSFVSPTRTRSTARGLATAATRSGAADPGPAATPRRAGRIPAARPSRTRSST